MGDRPNKRLAPFSLRLSFEERAKLENLADTQLPMAAALKGLEYDGAVPRRETERARPVRALGTMTVSCAITVTAAGSPRRHDSARFSRERVEL